MDMQFILSLQKPPDERSKQDKHNLLAYIRTLDDELFRLCDEALKSRPAAVRYESHQADTLLYKRADPASCWFIVLSGSVFIDDIMYLANDSFGRRLPGESLRPSNCLVLEPTEVMTVDYSHDGHFVHRRQISISTSDSDSHRRQNSGDEFRELRALRGLERRLSDQYPGELAGIHALIQHYPPLLNRYGSVASETSSLYSGSDLMASSTEEQSVDLTGLIESAVDSDDDDDYSEQMQSMPVRDAVCECLVKNPDERTDDDIEILLDEIQHLPAFNNMTLATRHALCGVMNYVVIDKADTVVMTDGEELDSWAVLLNGHCQIVRPDGAVEQLLMGDSFGITPTTEKLYHRGVMRTKVDNCQFVCIPQDDYYRILHEGEENTQRVMEKDQLVLITEERVDASNHKGRIIIRGSAEKLLSQLLEDQPSIDPTYVEDFLLTYRTFLSSPLEVANKLLLWFNNPLYREKVVSVILQWVTDHYSDFELEPKMVAFLEEFERLLQELGLKQQQLCLNKACASKARARTVVLTRVTREEILPFALLGGSERGCALFITKVEPGSKAEDAGLKRGDQILEVNGQSFARIPHNRALETLRASTHLSMTVRSNQLAFKDMLQAPSSHSGGGNKRASAKKQQASRRQSDPRLRLVAGRPSLSESLRSSQSGGGGGGGEQKEKAFLSTGHGQKIRNVLMRFNPFPRSNTSDAGWNSSNLSGAAQKGSSSGNSSPVLKTRFSSSHPDLSSLKLYASSELGREHQPEQVLKVFRADQAFKYLLVFKEMTAHEVVMLALKEFGTTLPSSDFCLCEVTVQQEGFVKQRRLPDSLCDLADRCSYNSRYYLKSNASSAALIPDELKDEIMRDCQISFLQLNCAEVAAQLSLKDFQMFHEIQQVEYVNDLFQLTDSLLGAPHLTRFAQLSNVEMFWVVSEVCSECNVTRRAKIIKHFILIAKHCQECKNYNSMFAIISGLGHGSVSRLKQTWDKLPAKYMQLFEDLQGLMDPSRNMSKYRNLIGSVQPPLIPFFPLVKKDLTFIHLGNDSKVDGLINFEKLRMVAKEVRHVCSMAPAYCDLSAVNRFASISTSAVAMLRQKQQRGSTVHIPRKMFEEAQMARRVRAYLTGRSGAMEDEARLADMSNQCEPPVTGLSVPRRREDGSSPIVFSRPLLNLGPKFGADSPDAVHKLMALSDRVRPHDPHRNKVTPSLSTVGSLKQTSSCSAVMVAPCLTVDSSSVVNHPLQSRALAGSYESDSFSPSSSVGSSHHASKPSAHRGGGHGVETDSGHHSLGSSSAAYDSNSTSSVGSTGGGSPSSVTLNPSESPCRPPQHSQSTGTLTRDSAGGSRGSGGQGSTGRGSGGKGGDGGDAARLVLQPGGGALEYPSAFVRKQHSIKRRGGGSSSRLAEAKADYKGSSANDNSQVSAV